VSGCSRNRQTWGSKAVRGPLAGPRADESSNPTRVLTSPELVIGHVNCEEVPVDYLEDENGCLRLGISAPLTEIGVSIVKMNNRSEALETGVLECNSDVEDSCIAPSFMFSDFTTVHVTND